MFQTALVMTLVIALVMTGGRLLSGKRPRPSVVIRDAIIGSVVNLPLIWLYLWVALPPMTGWFGGYFFLVLPLALNVVLATILSNEFSDDVVVGANSSAVSGLAVLAVLSVVWLAAAAYPVWGADDLRKIPQMTISDEKIEEASEEHIRLTPQETAEWLMEKVIGQDNLGSQFKVGKPEIQRIRGKLYWAAPLEFRGIFQWLNKKVTPGYVLVAVEEAAQQAELHIGYEMKYLPSAWFGDELHRFLYENGLAGYVIRSKTFEVDDNMKPWWVVVVTSPSVGLGGELLDRVVIVDPATGKMEHYPVGHTPKWADIVIPVDLAIEYNNWWGRYVRGWWNPAGDDMQKTTDIQGIQDAFLVWGKDDAAKWFTGFTSPSLSDNSLTGYSMMDSVTGKATFYKVSGFGHEGAVVEAVNAAVANFKGWHGSQPIFYGIYGQPTWVVPVLSETKILQKIAVVEASTMKVVLGDTKQEALAAYQLWLQEKGSGRAPTKTSALKEVEGRVLRIGSDVKEGTTIFQFTIDTAPDRIFKANSSVSDKLALTQVGDRVQVAFADTYTRAVAVSKFGNLDFMPEVEVVPGKPANIGEPTPTPTPAPTPTPTPKKYSE